MGCFPSKAHERSAATWKATGTISLRDAKLKELPASIEGVGKAALVLDASNNRLAALPPALASLTGLARLILPHNALRALPPQLTALSNLKVLVLDYNKLSALEGVCALPRLEKVSATHNALAALPAGVGRLKRLRELNVASNQLTALPDGLGACESLELVDAADNRISVLPEALGSLRRLKVLALDQNSIATVPPALLLGCERLQTLSLHENPITIEALAQTKGYECVEARRRMKHDKQIAAGVLMPSAGMDEGVDRRVAAR
ncbi:hypothetical protein WJX81_008424 [Elliptochloris bilobata]|uniref:Uncharacterized protein n=1 Tax=Elliptochloris bilobata TaxID=381761 RepID=A0AAW1SKE8_9CHLO